MTRPWQIAERDHEIQNPISKEKLRLLGSHLRLGPGSRVLDLACGTGGPALVLAQTYGCHVRGVEVEPAFAATARGRIAAAGLETLVQVEVGDAAAFALEADAWDAALCLGASFVWGRAADAAAALAATVRPGGHVAIGEPYWRGRPPAGVEAGDYVDLEATVAALAAAGLEPVGIVAASQDDWDRYESLHWRALAEWLDGAAPGPERDAAAERLEVRRRRHLTVRRELLGWAILIGRKPESAARR